MTAEENPSVGVVLEGIDTCVREWQSARREGQSILTALSNTLLLRTYVDKGRSAGVATDGADAWGALARSGDTVRRVSIATEARARRLHSDLEGAQDMMVSAAAGIRRYARDARGCSRKGATEAAGGEAERGGNGRVVSVGGGYAVEDVADAAAEVGEMLLREALVTATITQGVNDCRDRAALTMYGAAWMMQPYVDQGRLRDLLAMVRAAQSPRV